MPLEDITVENTVKTWSELRTFGNVILNPILTFFGFVFLLVTYYYDVVPPPENPIYAVIWLFLIMVTVITILRNRIIKKIFVKITPAKFYQFVYSLDRIMSILLLFFLVTTFLLFPSNGAELFLKLWSLSLSFLFLFGVFFMFTDAITDSGKIRILFNTFFSNIDDFCERQTWMKLAFEELETKLKKGKIEVSLDKLIYYCNVKLINAEDVKCHLVKIEQWMLGNQKVNVVDSLVQIIPKDEIKQLEKKSILDIYNEIPSELRTLLVFVIVLIIIACFFPEYVKEVIKLPLT